LKFQAVAEKTAKDARGLLYFATPGRMPIKLFKQHTSPHDIQPVTWSDTSILRQDQYKPSWSCKSGPGL